jgi:hypothetical protein
MARHDDEHRCVELFGRALRSELAANADKGHWRDGDSALGDVEALLVDVLYHVAKLVIAKDVDNRLAGLEFAADTGNEVMMVADLLGALNVAHVTELEAAEPTTLGKLLPDLAPLSPERQHAEDDPDYDAGLPPLKAALVAASERFIDAVREAVKQHTAPAEFAVAAVCGRTLIGQGTDAWDPTCQLLPGHAGQCSPETPPTPNDDEVPF